MIIIFLKRSGKCSGSLLIAKHGVDPQWLIHEKFATALVNSDLVTVGHIPKFITKLTYFFPKYGGHIKCEITGVKKYSDDLEQGGLEILARLTISYANKRMTDIMKEKLNFLVEETRKIISKPK